MTTEQFIAMFVIVMALAVSILFFAFALVFVVKDWLLPALHRWRVRRIFRPYRLGAKVTYLCMGKPHRGVVVEHIGEHLRVKYNSWLGTDYVHYRDVRDLVLDKLSPFEQRVQDYISKELKI